MGRNFEGDFLSAERRNRSFRKKTCGIKTVTRDQIGFAAEGDSCVCSVQRKWCVGQTFTVSITDC